MERINQYELYKMGQTLQKLRKEGELDPAEIFMDLILARGEMFQLLKGSPFPVTVSAVKSQELLDALDVVINKYFYRKDEGGKPSFSFPANGEHKIEPYEWNNIVTTLGHFETVFGEEMRDSATYYVPRRGIFNTKALVDSADEAFPKDVADLILEKTRTEWRAAGRCLAFNLLSASGFHVARAVEAAVEQYYQYFCAKGPDDTLHGWQDYIDALGKVKSDIRPNLKTLAELKQMKDDFRNPVVHPRIVLSEADARMLYNNGESLIIAMAQDLSAAKKNNPEAQTNFLGLINTAPLPTTAANE